MSFVTTHPEALTAGAGSLRGGRSEDGRGRRGVGADGGAVRCACTDVSGRQRAGGGHPRNIRQYPERELRVVCGDWDGQRGRDGLRSQ